MNKGLVILDRDGTINIDKGYVHEIQEFELIEGSLEALRLLTENHFAIYIVTNQAGIAKGYYSEKEFLEFTAEMTHFFEENGIHIDAVLYCPHHPNGVVSPYKKECFCRKPNNQLIKQAMERSGFSAQQTVLIGDKRSDIEAGNSLGIRTYLVETGYGKEERKNTNPNYVFGNLKEAVLHLIRFWNSL